MAVGGAVILASTLVWIQLPSRVSSAPIEAPKKTAGAGVVASHDYDDQHQAFSRSLTRLSDALNDFPQWKPADLLQAVAARTGACSFHWSNGQPALIYAGGESISGSLTRCAEAVERFQKTGASP